VTERRFPAPWTVESIPGGFKVLDADGQSLAYVYGDADARHHVHLLLAPSNSSVMLL
jgi:hypothetical protein